MISDHLDLLGLVRELVPPAASGCKVSPLEPLPAAFVAETLDSANKLSPRRIHKPGLALLHLLHKLSCSRHQLSGEWEAPVYATNHKQKTKI